MKRFLRSSGVAWLLALLVSPLASHAYGNQARTSSTGPMSVKVLSVIAPKIITKNNQPITVHVRVSGIQLDPTHIGRKSVAGHGHMQVYLDGIPAKAYKTPNAGTVVAIAAGPIFTFILAAKQRHAARGHHRFLIALAQNNNVLYPGTRPASFSLTIK